MYLGLLKEEKFIPIEYKKSIYDIDFLAYFNMGKRLILTDLDNTLMSYKEYHATDKVKELVESLKDMGYEIIITSNNTSSKRVKMIGEELDLKWLYFGMKPLKKCYKQALKCASRKYEFSEVITLGDQLMTDIFSSNRMGFDSILVCPVDKKTDKWTTKINRMIERHAIKKIKQKYPDLYKERLEQYLEDFNNA